MSSNLPLKLDYCASRSSWFDTYLVTNEISPTEVYVTKHPEAFRR
jgi:hypothetical protein